MCFFLGESENGFVISDKVGGNTCCAEPSLSSLFRAIRSRRKTACQIHFLRILILGQKKRLDHDSENSALDLIQRILREFGYFGLIIRFLDFAEKTQNSFLDSRIHFRISKKTSEHDSKSLLCVSKFLIRSWH